MVLEEAQQETIEVTAPSVEEAVILGLTRLTVTRDEVEIEVLDEGSRGFLGLGVRHARVRLTRTPQRRRPEPRIPEEEPAISPAPEETTPAGVYMQAEEPPPQREEPAAQQEPSPPEREAAPPSRPEPATPPQPEPAAQRKPQPEPERAQPQAERAAEKRAEPARQPKKPARSSRRRREEQPAGELDREALEQVIHQTAEHLLHDVRVEHSIRWLREGESRPTAWIALHGSDADSLVGPRAQTLNAVQYLFRALVHRQYDGNYNLIVDADGYRKRRRRSLERMAKKKADQAVETGRTVQLRSMPAHERRLIHIYLRKDDRVETESVGKGRKRAITIIPKR